MARIRKVTLYKTFLSYKYRSKNMELKITAADTRQSIAKPFLQNHISTAVEAPLPAGATLHFCVNKSSSHSICNFLGYKTKRQAAIPLGTHIITCCFSCISYASTSINARQRYQATPVSKKVGHDSRVGFSTFFAAACRASLIVTDNFFCNIYFMLDAQQRKNTTTYTHSCHKAFHLGCFCHISCKFNCTGNPDLRNIYNWLQSLKLFLSTYV